MCFALKNEEKNTKIQLTTYWKSVPDGKANAFELQLKQTQTRMLHISVYDFTTISALISVGPAESHQN